MTIAAYFLGFILVILLAAALYYYLLLLASIRELRSYPQRDPWPVAVDFAVIIPAHDEEAAIGGTIDHMKQMRCSEGSFDIVVVADHCHDRTAEVAREAGARCYERNDGPAGRKGYALAWLQARIMEENPGYHAFVVFDADSRPSENFLELMAGRLRQGAAAVQGQHVISNPNQSIFTHMADIDMRLNNRIRNLARRHLGLSCWLMGDGMCFRQDVLTWVPWSAFSLVEDKEYGIQLLKHGVIVEYEPDALSFGQAASGWARARSQRMRWSGGVLGLRRKHALQLFRSGLVERKAAYIDRAVELLLPPYSVLLLFSTLMLLAQLLIPSMRFEGLLLFNAGILFAWLFVPIFGLLLDGAPASLYPYVLLGPLYTIWRNWISLLTFSRAERVQWVRTKRSEESS